MYRPEHSKFTWKGKKLLIVKTILKKKSKVGKVSLCDLKINYIAPIIKNSLYWWRDRHIGQENRKPKIDPQKYAQVIFYKNVSASQWRKKKLFKQMMLE